MNYIKLFIIIILLLVVNSSGAHSATLDITNSSISPGSSINNSTTIKVSLTNESNVDIKIYELTRNKRILIKNLLNEKKPGNSAFQLQWDGRNDNDEIVGNGDYEIELILSDIAKPFRKASLKKEVRVETYYIIEELKFVPSPFSPSRETATVLFQLSKKAFITLRIFDRRGNPVITLVDNKKVSKGKNSISWDGKDTDDWFLEPGSYSCILEIMDAKRTEKRKSPFRIVEGIEIKNLTLIPEKINPDRMNNFASLSFTMDKNAEYNVKIFDAEGKEVWDSGINEGYAGENSISWGGLKKVSFRTKVNYIISVKRKGKEGKPGNIETINHVKILDEEVSGAGLKYTLKGKPKIYSNIKAEENPISLAELKRKIEGLEGDIIGAEIESSNIIYSSIKTESLPSGKYSVEINAKDPVTKELSAPKNTTVIIDLEKPFRIEVDKNKIRGINSARQFFPKEITTTEKKYAEVVIPYELTKDGNLKIQVLSVKGGIEKEMNMGRVLAGYSEARWDGTDQYGEIVGPGKYKIKILATDTVLMNKPKSIEFSYDIYVENVPRVVSSMFQGTNVFYTFELADYLFPSPIITTRDVINQLVEDLDKRETNREGKVVIDFKFSEQVAVGCIVIGDTENGMKEIIQKKEWSGTYTDDDLEYRWQWDGIVIAEGDTNPFFEKYGLVESVRTSRRVSPGTYNLWLFAVPKDEKNEAVLGKFMESFTAREQLKAEELQQMLEDGIPDKKMVFINKELKGLGIFTEIALHIEGSINKGLGEFINYIK